MEFNVCIVRLADKRVKRLTTRVDQSLSVGLLVNAQHNVKVTLLKTIFHGGGEEANKKRTQETRGPRRTFSIMWCFICIIELPHHITHSLMSMLDALQTYSPSIFVFNKSYRNPKTCFNGTS